ncbi:hypothetical protein [Nocardia cerradoensis]|nr:hypothetical protein [Nocardia cerradoensis]
MVDMGYTRHIHIESGALTLDYRASAEQAQNVAAELMRGVYSEFGLRIIVDDNVTDELPSLPCGGLWE